MGGLRSRGDAGMNNLDGFSVLLVAAKAMWVGSKEATGIPRALLKLQPHLPLSFIINPTMVSWSTVQTLLVLFGPILYTRGKAFYQSTKSRGPPQPLPKASRRLLNVLFVTALIALASTFEYFTPENIFTLTDSRLLQTPTDVLFNRVSHIRELTPSDEILRRRLSSKEGRLLYATYGPGPLSECAWCKVDDPNTFFFYALPMMALPHLLHIAVIGIVTSSFFSRHGAIWRTQATIAGVALFLGEIYTVGISTSAHTLNTIAKTQQETKWTHWSLFLYRGVFMAALDGILGYFVFLSGTGRWTLGLEGVRIEERLETLTKSIEIVASRLHADNLLRQTILRDKTLRERMVDHWTSEENIAREIMEDDEVQQSRINFATNRSNLDKLEEEAGKKSEGVVDRISAWRGFPAGKAS